MKASEIESILHNPTKVNRGVYTVAKPYYYRMIKAEDFKNSVIEKLKENNIEVELVGYGDLFKAFRGGEGVWKQSHFWVKFKITSKGDKNE